MKDVEVEVAVDVPDIDVESGRSDVAELPSAVRRIRRLRTLTPNAALAVGDRLVRQLLAARVELREEAEAIVQEDARRDLATEDSAVARVHEVHVAVVVEVTEVAVAGEIDEAATRQDLARVDR